MEDLSKAVLLNIKMPVYKKKIFSVFREPLEPLFHHLHVYITEWEKYLNCDCHIYDSLENLLLKFWILDFPFLHRLCNGSANSYRQYEYLLNVFHKSPRELCKSLKLSCACTETVSPAFCHLIFRHFDVRTWPKKWQSVDLNMNFLWVKSDFHVSNLQEHQDFGIILVDKLSANWDMICSSYFSHPVVF